MDPICTVLIVLVSAVFGAIAANTFLPPSKSQQLGAGSEQKLLSAETPEFVKKLHQLAIDQNAEIERLVGERMPKILDEILGCAIEKSVRLYCRKLFPEITKGAKGVKETRNVLVSYLRATGLNVTPAVYDPEAVDVTW